MSSLPIAEEAMKRESRNIGLTLLPISSYYQNKLKKVQDKAVHEMQVNLNQEMERMLPNFIKRRYMVTDTLLQARWRYLCFNIHIP